MPLKSHEIPAPDPAAAPRNVFALVQGRLQNGRILGDEANGREVALTKEFDVPGLVAGEIIDPLTGLRCVVSVHLSRKLKAVGDGSQDELIDAARPKAPSEIAARDVPILHDVLKNPVRAGASTHTTDVEGVE